MKKIIDFEIPSQNYVADVCVIRCFDDRFRLIYQAFINGREFLHPDEITLPGGVKALTDGGASRDVMMEAIHTSIKLHNAKRVVLIAHIDCGGYGGSAVFVDRDAERNHHQNELSEAAKVLGWELPDSFPIEAYLMTFDGLYDAGIEEVKRSAAA